MQKLANNSVLIWTLMNLAACGFKANPSGLKEAWNSANNPEIISGQEFKAEFSKLPLSGDADAKGWTDDYWPTYKGGISYRWQGDEVSYPLENLKASQGIEFAINSPAEKFDIMMNRPDFPTVLSERRRTKILKTVEGAAEFESGYKIPLWEGICHGWAPAAHNFKEPQKAVSVKVAAGNTVTFYPSDIKALLSFYQQDAGNRSTKTVFMSERCQIDFAKLDDRLAAGEISDDEWAESRESSRCKDMNAASLHLLLANELGLKKLGFIVDVTRDFEVWNQPVNSFSSSIKSESLSASEGAAPGTVKEISIETQMRYSVEANPDQLPLGVQENVKTYEYVLEINEKDIIIGGRWISDDRPDFAWRESVPVFQGYFAALKNIYLNSL